MKAKDDDPNPFRFGEVVKVESFCQRPELTKQLRSLIVGGQNAVVLGERRTGKTSLMLDTAAKIRGQRVLYAHLWSVGSIEDLANRILQGVVSMHASQSSILDKAVKTLTSLRPIMQFDPLTGQPSLTVGQTTDLLPSSLHGLFDLIAILAEQKKLVVIFDEFQDIRRIENSEAILGEIRGRVQLHSGIPYLFAGSIRHEMERMFRDPSSPFFKSFRTVDVGPIEEKRFKKFIDEKFQAGNRVVGDDVYQKIFEITANNPSDVQQFCSAIWERSVPGDSITVDDLPRILKYIFATERKGYEYLIRPLTNQQLTCLKTLARIGGEHPQSKAFLAESGIKVPASVKRALQRLIDLEIIYGPELNHKFFDPFFREWLNYGFQP